MTIPAVAIFRAKAGTEEMVETLFRSVIDTRLAEEGCISYQLNRDVEDARRFVWTEELKSGKAGRCLSVISMRLISRS